MVEDNNMHREPPEAARLRDRYEPTSNRRLHCDNIFNGKGQESITNGLAKRPFQSFN
jgi:hypothetical protein